MWNKEINISLAAIVVFASMGSLVEANAVEISAVNTPADLDLPGDVVYAVNFGNNGNPRFGDFVFSQDQDYPNLTFTTTAEGETSTWEGLPPNTGDSNLDMLLHGVTWKNSAESRTTSINAGGLVVGTQYQLQLIFYTNHSRPMKVFVEGNTVIEQYGPFTAQGSVEGQGGSLVKLNFTAGDATLNIDLTPIPDDGSLASAISGFILASAADTPEQPISFADCGSGTTIELAVGKGIWQLNWGQGPWTWSEMTGPPLLDANVSGILDLHATGAADVSADLVATLPIAGTLSLSAHDERHKDVITGTMVLSGTGINAIDIDASRVLVDEGSGMFLAPFHPPAPKLALTLDEATGVFAYIGELRDCELYLAGSYAAPLVKGLGLQDNILAALGGKVPVIGGIGTFALSGQYVQDMSRKVRFFCEYGKGVASQLGAGGAVWEQTWGHGPYDWHDCDVDPDASILGNDVVGVLETTTAGAPRIDEDLILRFDFGGNLSLTDYNDSDLDRIAGQILGDVKGTFVADMNAANAVVDEGAGTITIVFGAAVNDEPDALITVTQTTGTFENTRPVGVWEWYVLGTIACARVPTLSVQDNILAALGNSDLLLGAEEEIVLSGSYYRGSPQE